MKRSGVRQNVEEEVGFGDREMETGGRRKEELG